MTRSEKAAVREYVKARYESRDGRNIRIHSDGSVSLRVDGDGSQMTNGKDMTEGRIFAGWADDILHEIEH